MLVLYTILLDLYRAGQVRVRAGAGAGAGRAGILCGGDTGLRQPGILPCPAWPCSERESERKGRGRGSGIRRRRGRERERERGKRSLNRSVLNHYC